MEIYAEIHPTEDVEKVSQAIKNIFGEVKLNADSNHLQSQLVGIDSLEHLRYIIARDRIRASIKRRFNRIKEEKVLRFSLNRQAAFAGHVSFYHIKASVLGPIQITVMGNVENFIEYVCR